MSIINNEPTEYLLQATDGFIDAAQAPAPDLIFRDLQLAYQQTRGCSDLSDAVLREKELASFIPQFHPPMASQVPQLTAELFDWYKQAAHSHPLVRASLLFLKLIEIRPFSEGNTAIAWYLMNLSLQQAGLLPLHIDKTMRPFFRYAEQRYLESNSSGATVILFAQLELQALFAVYPIAAHSLHNHYLRLGLDGPCSRVIP